MKHLKPKELNEVYKKTMELFRLMDDASKLTNNISKKRRRTFNKYINEITYLLQQVEDVTMRASTIYEKDKNES